MMITNANVGMFKVASGATTTRGKGVSISADGEISTTATATLWQYIGCAMQDCVAGQYCPVQLDGYCDYAFTDGALAADTEVLFIADGGVYTATGGTQGGLDTSDATLAAGIVNTVARGLGEADVSTLGKIWLVRR